MRAIDVADLVDDGGPIRARISYVAAVGDLASIPDQALAFVSGGRVVATVATSSGDAELPAGLGVPSLGVYRAGASALAEPLAAIEQWVAVIRPGERPLILYDSELSADMLRALSTTSLRHRSGALPSVRPTRSCRSIRDRLRAMGFTPLVIDARAVLDEGEALDVSDPLDPVRLARVASRLKSRGFAVTAIVHRGVVQPLATVASTPSEGNRVELKSTPPRRAAGCSRRSGSTQTLISGLRSPGRRRRTACRSGSGVRSCAV
jgi:hypothetical protein